MTNPPPSPDWNEDAPGVPLQPAEKKTPLLLRLKMPVWIALILWLATALFAWFITGPGRSTATAVERSLSNAQRVEMTLCLTNEQVRDPQRASAINDLEKELRAIGAQDVLIRVETPCDRQNPTPAATR